MNFPDGDNNPYGQNELFIHVQRWRLRKLFIVFVRKCSAIGHVASRIIMRSMTPGMR